jgi:hypothetical protein
VLTAAGPAFAHGEQIVLMAVGNLVALVAVVIAALTVKVDWVSRVLAIPLALLVGLPPYFVTNRYIPDWISSSEAGWFIAGFLPPLAGAGLFLYWRWRARQPEAPRPPSK